MITVKDHHLVSTDKSIIISYSPTPNHGTTFNQGLPEYIVMHYTGGSSLESTVNWLKDPASKASAHVIIGKNGEIVQMVPFNLEAWHAGISEWMGRKNLNHFSIGIELENAGLLEKRVDGYYTYWGKRIDNSQVVLATHKHKKEEQAWEAFTEKQIATVEKIVIALKTNYPVKDIVGHDDIAPGRKIDPGPAFPLAKIKNKLFLNRNEEETFNLNHNTNQYGIVIADYLNIRSGPSIQNLTVSEPLPKGTKLKIVEEKNGWLKVAVDIQGWVNQQWVEQL